MCIGLHVEYPVFLSDANEIWIFSTYFKKILISNFMNIHPMGAEFLPCGRTDMTKLIVPFRNFVNALKNCLKRCLKTEAVKIEVRSCYACPRKDGPAALLITGAGRDVLSAFTIDFHNVDSCTCMSSSDGKRITAEYWTGLPFDTDAGSVNSFDFTMVKNVFQ
jgi:hypothetical protein